jgi:pimeloyl-ACP methyl ester carboxylesterase
LIMRESESTEPESSSSYIVIAPKLSGYQDSSHLGRGHYTVLQVAQQVICFLRVLLKEYNKKKLHFVGHEWGALIGMAVCQLQPDMIASFVNIAMPCTWHLESSVMMFPRQILYSWYIFLFQFPLVPQYVIRYNNCAFLQKLWKDWSPRLPLPSSSSAASLLKNDPKKSSPSSNSSSSSTSSLQYYLDLVKLQFQSMSIVLNALDYYRCNFRNVWMRRPLAMTSHALLLGKHGQGGAFSSSFPVPTLAIGGALDGCIMTDVFQASHRKQQSKATFALVIWKC